ncbi:MAG: hypothetical protein HYW95_00905 [Candidatus Wildermuthbacteria bacterium]|nr:hypothetical protein [Candidatus Wildermuthbacteria bacterium]
MPQLHPTLQKYIAQFQLWQRRIKESGEERTIEVDEVIARVALFYEKIRGIVDWREEHLLRKTAIERILKRRILFATTKDIAEPLLLELVRGGHFPNRQIPVSQIETVQHIIDTYVSLLEESSVPPGKIADVQSWLFSIAASEIEEILDPPIKERVLIEYVTEAMRERLSIAGKMKEQPNEEEIQLQLYIAAHRALFKFDDSIITYHLLQRLYSHWGRLSPEEISSIASRILKLRDFISQALLHPLSEKFYQLTERYDTPYLLIGDIFFDPNQIIQEIEQNPAVLEQKIRNSYNDRLFKLRARLRRAAFYSVISIFLTKVLVASAIELPFEKFFIGYINFVALGLGISIPSFLMAFLVLTTRSSSEENLQRTILEVTKAAYAAEDQPQYQIVLTEPKRGFLHAIIRAFYYLTFVITFGGIIWGLRMLSFNPVSIAIFLMFISLVAFAGMKIRQRSKELIVREERPSILWTTFELFFLPIIDAGKWLSSKLVRYNILVVIFNFLIEAPFQVFIDLLEQWRLFIKEKEEEIH